MHYNVIFDVTQAGFHHWKELGYTVIIATLAIGFLWYKRNAGWRSLANPIVLFMCLFSLFRGFMFFYCYWDYLSLKSAMRQSKCEVIEGIVAQFQLLPRMRGDSPGESFVVNGKQFRYRENSIQNGFHQIGVIRDGLQVRIYYFDTGIARLEIAQ